METTTSFLGSLLRNGYVDEVHSQLTFSSSLLVVETKHSLRWMPYAAMYAYRSVITGTQDTAV